MLTSHRMDQMNFNRSCPGRPRIRPNRLRGDKACSSRTVETHIRDRNIATATPQLFDQIG